MKFPKADFQNVRVYEDLLFLKSKIGLHTLFFKALPTNKNKDMSKIKILIDARIISGESQGSVTYLKGLYNSLYNNHGSVYDLFFAGYDFADMKEAFPFLEENRFILLTTSSKIKLLTWDFPRIINKYKIEFAHFQYITPLIKNCKFIVTTHDVLFNDFQEYFPKNYALKRNFLFKNSLQRSDIRLTVSDYSQFRIAAHYGIDINSLHITPNAVRKEFFEEFDKETVIKEIESKFGARNYLLYVSRIEPRKNHSIIIDAYRKLKLDNKDIHLVFIGNNTLDSKKETKAINQMKADFPEHFHWYSGLSDEEVLSFYRGAKMFIYPSKAEGFGIPPIEAGAAGINTLCSTATAMQDFTFLGGNLFSPEAPETLATKILDNLSQPKRKGELSYIREKIRTKYSWETSSNLLNRLIKEQVKVLHPANVPYAFL
ncbi:MAG: glycosyltransferase involved in cell wall biosynthesis [Saprospiraceae bacterium]